MFVFIFGSFNIFEDQIGTYFEHKILIFHYLIFESFITKKLVK